MSIQSTNPPTSKVIKTFEEMSETEVESLITKSDETFTNWKKHLTQKRHKYYIMRLVYQEKKQKLAQIITLEMVKLGVT